MVTLAVDRPIGQAKLVASAEESALRYDQLVRGPKVCMGKLDSFIERSARRMPFECQQCKHTNGLG
jgi:hypothetical protein